MRPRPFANLKTYRPPKEIPRREPPGVPYLQYSTRKSGVCAGEGWAGEAPEGPASPKGFTGWDGPGKSVADFSSGEQTVDGNSYLLLQQATLVDGLRCMTEKMQEVARSVPPGGAFQGGSLQGLFFGESLHDLRLQEDCDWKRAAQKLKRLPCVKGAVSEAD